MFRPGNLGHLGRLGLVAASRPGLVAQALAILAKYGSAANLYFPGVGAINGITAGNWLDTVGGTPATVDGAVGTVVNARGGANLTQATTANKPILRRGLVNLLTQSDFQNGLTDAPLRGGLVTASTLAGYGGALAFGHNGATVSYAYKSFGAIANTYYTVAAVVKMDDSGAPTFGDSFQESVLNTFAIVSQGDAINPLSYTKAQLADGCWIVCGSYSKTVAGSNTGVVKYPTNNNRTFKVTRYGLFVGQKTAQQIIDAGGTPITTTSPASSASGSFAWQFDGSDDSFASTLTPGNAGFFCSGAQVNDSGVLRTLLGAGAGSDASSGVWLARQVSSNLLMLQVGNGTTRNSIGAPYPVATNAVASAGWDSSAMFVGINNTETSGAKTVDCTSTNTMNIGVLTGTTNPMLGTIGATIIMPTVLPTATERATLRQFIASLSGVTM